MDIKTWLQQKNLVFDGAMGTMLQRRGLKPVGLPELLNLTDPALVLGIHQDYVAAGADVVSTNTFQANRFKLAHCGHSVEEIIRSGVGLAKQSGARFVALDVGPLGQLLEPMGTLKWEGVASRGCPPARRVIS